MMDSEITWRPTSLKLDFHLCRDPSNCHPTLRPDLSRPEAGGSAFWVLLLFGGTGDGIVKAADDALLAKHDHGVEERRRHGLPDDGHASGINQ
jgi:hypothetical protein